MAKSTSSTLSSNYLGTTTSGGGGGTGASGGGGVNPAPIIPEVILFALTPGQYNASVPIDYKSITDIKLFNREILKLPELFDGE